jgi:hypothetical protein
MPTQDETDFLADPPEFMRHNILRVITGKHDAIQRFCLVEDADVLAFDRTSNGPPLRYFKLMQHNTGPIEMYFLDYADNTVRETTLGIAPGTPNLMVTVNLNGCSFGYAQSSTNSGAYVTHHNDRTGDGNVTTIEGQLINNPFPNTDFHYFHQSGYRKSRGIIFKKLDKTYQCTIIGVRDNHNHWHFYYQARKDKYNKFNRPAWTLKGVGEINPA